MEKQDNWKHRSDGMKCATCMWYVKKEAQGSVEIGRCRRHAPTMNGFPVVYPADWCGDHKMDETRLRPDFNKNLFDAVQTETGGPRFGPPKTYETEA